MGSVKWSVIHIWSVDLIMFCYSHNMRRLVILFDDYRAFRQSISDQKLDHNSDLNIRL